MSKTGQQIVKVRAATQADTGIVGQWGAELVALHHGFDTQRFIQGGPGTPAKYASFIESQLGRPDVIVLVAEDETSLLGYVYAANEGNDYMSLRGPAGVIHDIFVAPDRRSQGIGRALLNQAIKELCSKGAELVVLSTAYRNEAAQRLFAAGGFRPTMIEMTNGPDGNGQA